MLPESSRGQLCRLTVYLAGPLEHRRNAMYMQIVTYVSEAMETFVTTSSPRCDWPERERVAYRASLKAAKLWIDKISNYSLNEAAIALCSHADDYKWDTRCTNGTHGFNNTHHLRSQFTKSFTRDINGFARELNGLCLDCTKRVVQKKSAECRYHP